MKRWEYKIVSLPTNSMPIDKIELALSHHGALGWKVIEVNWPNSGHILLRRERASPGDGIELLEGTL